MNDALGPDKRLALQNEPFHRIVGDEVFVLTRDSQMHWLKNTTARHIWDELVRAGPAGRTPRELATALALEFEVDSEDALPDVLGFVAHLTERGLLGRSTSQAPSGD